VCVCVCVCVCVILSIDEDLHFDLVWQEDVENLSQGLVSEYVKHLCYSLGLLFNSGL